jgi:multiple sugar transport system permease protein
MKATKKWTPARRNDISWAYIMIAPNLLGLALFFIWPIFQTIYFSFTEWGDFGKYKFAGLVNYNKMLHDPNIWLALKNTARYTVFTVPASIAISIVIAVLLNQKIKGVSIYRTLYYLPVVTMPVAIAMVWKWLYNADFGLINHVLSGLSITGPRWITDPSIAPYSIILVGIWSSIGYNMIIFLAGLQGISRSYYEAAKIDGAGAFSQFINITLPILSPTIFFVTIMSLIYSFQVFDLIWMMIGDNNISIVSTQSLVYLFYKEAFVLNDKGYAAGIAVLLLIIILIVTIIQMAYQKKWVHYE